MFQQEKYVGLWNIMVSEKPLGTRVLSPSNQQNRLALQ